MKAISVTTSGSTLSISGGGGSMTATVANQEGRRERIVVAVVPQGTPGGATPTATVERPLREIDAGASEQYLVTFGSGTAPAGSYPVKIVAYPADEAPEEYAPSGQRVEVVVAGGPPPVARPARRFPWWIVVVAAAVVVVIAAVAFVLTRPKNVAVPSVLTKVQADAEKTLSDAGLSPSVKTVLSPPPLGVVVSQSPDPATEVARGTTVTITVSSGVTVPDETKKPADVAQADLVKLGLKVITQAQESDVAPGTVLGQTPAAGTRLGTGETVTLRVATVRLVVVPDTAGMTVGQVLQSLSALGLQATFQNNFCFPVSCTRVSASAPPAGAKVPKGTVVTLFVTLP
jgi:beta-lactam-binding protein with PASTA domain